MIFTSVKMRRDKEDASRPQPQLTTPTIRTASDPQFRYSVRSALRATLLLALLGSSSTSLAVEPPELMRGFGRTQLILSTSTSGCTLIDAYVAQNRAQRAQGLMHVKSMGSHEGMLFLYPRETVISMWMKNTYIPLDMLFADSQGIIVHLHAGAIPHDTTVISSAKPAALVLELNAGSIASFGIKVGDTLSLPENDN